jgi:hypothetical protein
MLVVPGGVAAASAALDELVKKARVCPKAPPAVTSTNPIHTRNRHIVDMHFPPRKSRKS